MWGCGCGDGEEGADGTGDDEGEQVDGGWWRESRMAREGTGKRPGKEEVRPTTPGCLALDTGDIWGHLQEWEREKEVWRKT